MTIFMYSTSYCAFFVGWWLFSLKRRWWTLILSLGFFLMSFDTASFLVFMAIPLLHSYFEHRATGGPFITWIKRNFVFVLSPIAYWFVEPIINPTLDSVRAAYYTPSLSGILRGLVVGMLVTLIAGYFVLIRGWRYGTHRGGVQVLVGLLITWLGMFPYMALGHFPNLNALLIGFVPGASDWDSRHQLLMPLGLGLVIVGVLNFLNPARLWAGVLVVCGLSTVLNLTFSQEYYLDSIKTQRIIEAFRSNPDVKDFDMALIDDQALRFNARGRAIRSYEWDYMLRAANPGLELSLGEVTNSLVAFDNSIQAYGMNNDVITVVMSEFGRTLDPASGGGSDHAWGNHWFAMGGPVKGGVVYGSTFPTLQTGGVDDASLYKPYRGQWLPQFSSDQFMADLVGWLGLTPAQALAVMPNLANFPSKTIGYI